MRLGINTGPWGGGVAAQSLELVLLAEELGYEISWVSEAYGSDVVSVLGWLAAKTTRIEIGSSIAQMPARSPVMTAMSAATLDALSGGRFRLGVGVSGPQVSEGLHGVLFDRPLARTREYVDIVRMALDGDKVEYRGRYFQLPLRSSQRRLRLLHGKSQREIPIYLAAIGPRNVALAGECFDGLLAMFVDPRRTDALLAAISAGRNRARKPMKKFDIVASVPVAIGGDLDRCVDRVRPFAALYLGGMGSREQNFYNRLASQMGYGSAAREVQERYLAGDRDGAAAAVPAEFILSTSLLGDRQAVYNAMARYESAGINTLAVSLFDEGPEERASALRVVSEVRDSLAER